MNLHTITTIGQRLFHDDGAQSQRRAALRAMTHLCVKAAQTNDPLDVAAARGARAVVRAMSRSERERDV